MKIIYKALLSTMICSVAITANAQNKNDSTFSRQILVERDYTPSLQDASKINTMPDIYNPVMPKQQINFLSQAPSIGLKKNLLGNADPGEIVTDIDFSKKRGYLTFGGGTNANLDGAFGYQLLNTENDKLDISANHNSTNGNVDYESKDYFHTKAKAKSMDNRIGLGYQHKFSPAILSINAAYFNNSYNYYGNPYIINYGSAEDVEAIGIDRDSKQNIGSFGVGAGIQSREDGNNELSYRINVGYNTFKNKYGPTTGVDGAKGEQINVAADFGTDLGADKQLGVESRFMNQSFGKLQFATLTGAYNSLSVVEATPYIRFDGLNWNLKLGAKIGAAFDNENTFNVSPEIKSSVAFADRNVFYLNVIGGINDNTFLHILQENRYVNPLTRIGHSNTVYDALIGVKVGAVEGVEIDAFAGYKQTKKDHLYLSTSPFDENDNITSSWGNTSTPVYADLSTGNIGASVKTGLIPRTDLSATIRGYFYNVKYKDGSVPSFFSAAPSEKKAWGLPSFSVDVRADVKVLENLSVSMDYIFKGGRKTYFQGLGAVSMNNINELNFGGSYQILDWISVNAHLNNVLSQKYEEFAGYTLQGFNAMGGVSLKF